MHLHWKCILFVSIILFYLVSYSLKKYTFMNIIIQMYLRSHLLNGTKHTATVSLHRSEFERLIALVTEEKYFLG